MIFSSRTEGDRTPNDLSRLRAEMIAGGQEILDLTESNPTRCGFDYPEEAILRAMADPTALTYAPDPKGIRSAREAVAEVLEATVEPDQLVLTASTSEAYAWLFKLLCEPEDEVLIPRPGYPLFDFIGRLEGIRLVPYPLVYEDRWRLDPGALERRIGPRTRAVVVVQPNNPTGSYLEAGEVETLRRLCRRRQLPIISDEVFFGYRLEDGPERPRTLAGVEEPLTFVLGGLSKHVGLPQMKLAWIVVSGPESQRREALERLELIGDTFLSVGTPVQCGVARLLEEGRRVHEQILRRVRGNLAEIMQLRGSEASWDCLRVEGGWSAVLRVPRVVSDQEWARLLLEQDRLLLHPGYLFDFTGEGHLVVSLLLPEELFREGMVRFAARVAAVTG